MTEAQIPVLLARLQELVMGSTLIKCAATDLGIQWLGWAVAAALRTEKFYDLAGNSSNYKPCADCFMQTDLLLELIIAINSACH